MTWSDEWRRVRAIVWKDLTTERRSKSGLNAVAFMGILVLLLFGFALGPDTQALRAAVTIAAARPAPAVRDPSAARAPSAARRR